MSEEHSGSCITGHGLFNLIIILPKGQFSLVCGDTLWQIYALRREDARLS